jgi:hypothetical protein
LHQPLQGFLAGGAQRRHIDLHDVPKSVFPDGVVLVPQAVSDRSYLLPGLTRHKGRGQIARFSRSFVDSFETTLNRIVGFWSFSNAAPSMPAADR